MRIESAKKKTVWRGAKTSIVIVAAVALCIVAGCQSSENPWAVQQYRSPGEFTPTPQSTYAPVPRILPSIEGGGFESLSQPNSGDAADELELILNELQIK